MIAQFETKHLTEIIRDGDNYQARYEVPQVDVIKYAHPVYTNVASAVKERTTSRTLKHVSSKAVQRVNAHVVDIDALAAKELAAWVKVARPHTVEADDQRHWIIRVSEVQ